MEIKSDNKPKGNKHTKRKKKHWFLRLPGVLLLLCLVLVYLILKYFFNIGIWIPKEIEKADVENENYANHIERGTTYEIDPDFIRKDDETGRARSTRHF